MFKDYINKLTNIRVDKNIKILIIVAICISILIDLIVLNNVLNQKFIVKDKKILNYNINSKVDYDVSMAANDLFESKVLGPNRIYITKLIDKINLSHSLNFDTDELTEVKGNYEVKAIVYAVLPDDQKNRVIWDKNYPIIQKTAIEYDQDVSMTEQGFTMRKKFPLDIRSYLNLVNSINKKYEINYSTILKVVWDVSISAKAKNKEINEKFKHVMSIPIDEKQFQINGDLNYVNNDSIKEKVNDVETNHYIKMFILVSLLFLLLISLIYVIVFIKVNNEEDYNEKRFKNIKRLYGERIVSVVKPIVYRNQKIIEVAEIEDLVKVSDDLSKPMLYNYANSGRDKNQCFYILNEDELYIYNFRVIQ